MNFGFRGSGKPDQRVPRTIFGTPKRQRPGAVMDKPAKKPSGSPPFGKPVESSDFAAGVAAGALMERQRIVALLKTDEARRTCGCTGVWRVADKLAAGGWTTPASAPHGPSSETSRKGPS